ncbi:transcription antitermination factor NusB [Actinomyces gaoshouyii]|nr:transcription antitermination factor NusB [Actinomyces gaoshouyii]
MPADDAARAADPRGGIPAPSVESPSAPRSSRAASKHAVTARTKARRRAIEILFEADQKGLLRPSREGDPSGAPERLRDLAVERAVHSANHTEAPAYTREILAGLADHLAEVDDAIEAYAQGWTLARMPAVDRAIARVAVWEIVHNDDVDAPVAVDEAMTLARILSTDDSPRYLGGLLGRVVDLADTLR